MKYTTTTNKVIFSLIVILLSLSGCSSDNSSETSSGGGSTTTVSATPVSTVEPVPVSSISGTYVGTATATASALGLSESETIPVTITIGEDGKITIKSGSDIFPDIISLNGNTFNVSQAFTDQAFGAATCSGILTLQGTVDNNGRISASLSSQSVSCNGIPGTVTGSLTASKI